MATIEMERKAARAWSDILFGMDPIESMLDLEKTRGLRLAANHLSLQSTKQCLHELEKNTPYLDALCNDAPERIREGLAVLDCMDKKLLQDMQDLKFVLIVLADAGVTIAKDWQCLLLHDGISAVRDSVKQSGILQKMDALEQVLDLKDK